MVVERFDKKVGHWRFLKGLLGKYILFNKENKDIDDFHGSLFLYNEEKFDISSVILRGSVLKNVNYIYVVVLQTGSKCRIYQNAVTSRSKKSYLERKISHYIYITLLL